MRHHTTGRSGLAILWGGLSTAVAAVGLLGSLACSLFEPTSPTPVPIVLGQPTAGIVTGSENQKVYEFSIAQPSAVRIDVVGDFDNYLELYAEGQDSPMASDDDSGNGLNAMLNVTLQPGTYYALVRPYSEGITGAFTITVSAPGQPVAATPGVPTPTMPGVPTPTMPGMPTPTMPGMPTPTAGPPGPMAEVPATTIGTRTYSGIVSSTSGTTVVTPGTPCSVEVSGEATRGGHNCRVRVFCGGQVIYGRDEGTTRYGFNRCTAALGAAGPVAIEAHDQNPSSTSQDPLLDLQTWSNSAVVSDTGPAGSWNVMITLSGAATPGSP